MAPRVKKNLYFIFDEDDHYDPIEVQAVDPDDAVEQARQEMLDRDWAHYGDTTVAVTTEVARYNVSRSEISFKKLTK